MNIARSGALEKYGRAAETGNRVQHYKDRELSPEAQAKIKVILMEEELMRFLYINEHRTRGQQEEDAEARHVQCRRTTESCGMPKARA